ncbi:hypothetical protein BV898_02591 [Hypsibius exemplaris]|uniref:Ubiquitin-like domain-containing protein n=1 Tax=Hypsibius exemplaris TaxID=2072580 RepID=A0A1W0X824_HYPEX|nr:hypothetical protein BV898_02591 [Hypsibius exemplaris]
MDTPAGMLQKVLVKTPLSADGKEDLTVEIPASWTVRQLKQRLSEVLPKKTNPDDQRLIFSGSLLADGRLLKECFRSVEPGSCPVVHLVCKPAASIPSPMASIPEVETLSEGLHHRNVPQSATSAAYVNPWMAPAASMNFDPNHMAQYYQNYQAYLQQYMYSQYHHLNPAMLHHHQAPHFPHLLHNMTPGQANLLQMNPQPAGFGDAQHIHNHNGRAPEAPAARDPQVVVNAHGGAENDAGDQRDAFDYVYIGFRLCALLFVVYLSSSATRFFSVFTMLSVFLFFNTLRDFRRWRERQLRRNAEAAAAAAAPVVPPAERAVPVAGEGAGAGENVQNVAQPGEAPPPAEPEAGLLTTVLSLVVGFITSLVPDLNGIAA